MDVKLDQFFLKRINQNLGRIKRFLASSAKEKRRAIKLLKDLITLINLERLSISTEDDEIFFFLEENDEEVLLYAIPHLDYLDGNNNNKKKIFSFYLWGDKIYFIPYQKEPYIINIVSHLVTMEDFIEAGSKSEVARKIFHLRA